jgi:hypothetical protein
MLGSSVYSQIGTTDQLQSELWDSEVDRLRLLGYTPLTLMIEKFLTVLGSITDY